MLTVGFFYSSRRRHTRCSRDWSSDVCSSDLDLASLLEYAVGHTRHVRCRLSSLEPEALKPRLLEAMGDDALCPHAHIPVQSGSDRILARMRRKYDTRVLTDGVAALKAVKSGIFLAADVIVGFPGETDNDFNQTVALIEGLEFASLHVFPFSSRPGTAATVFKERVPEREMKDRLRLLLDLGHRLTQTYLSGWTGQQADVLLEKRVKADVWNGSSAQSVKCRVEGVPGVLQRQGARVWAEILDTGNLCRAESKNAGEGPPVFSRRVEI